MRKFETNLPEKVKKIHDLETTPGIALSMRSTPSSVAMSVDSVVICDGFLDLTFSRGSRLLPTAKTWYPFEARFRARPSPIPVPAPVMIAHFFIVTTDFFKNSNPSDSYLLIKCVHYCI